LTYEYISRPLQAYNKSNADYNGRLRPNVNTLLGDRGCRK